MRPNRGSDLEPFRSRMRYPDLVSVPRRAAVRVLEDRARALGAHVVRRAEVSGLRQDAAGVDIDGPTRTARARFVRCRRGAERHARSARELLRGEPPGVLEAVRRCRSAKGRRSRRDPRHRGTPAHHRSRHPCGTAARPPPLPRAKGLRYRFGRVFPTGDAAHFHFRRGDRAATASSGGRILRRSLLEARCSLVCGGGRAPSTPGRAHVHRALKADAGVDPRGGASSFHRKRIRPYDDPSRCIRRGGRPGAGCPTPRPSRSSASARYWPDISARCGKTSISRTRSPSCCGRR